MRIEKIRVQNFLSIKDSSEINFNEKTICLIGKNESGKTSLLRALQSFDSDSEFSIEDLCSYSDAKRRYERGEIELGEIESVTVWFRTDNEDKKALRTVSKELSKLESVKITKYFDNKYFTESPDLELETVALDVNSIIKEIGSEVDNLLTTLEQYVKDGELTVDDFTSFRRAIEVFKSLDLSDLSHIEEKFSNLYKGLRGVPIESETIRRSIATTIEKTDGLKNDLKSRSQIEITEEILNLIPNFIYFDDVDLLEDKVKISTFLKDRSKHKTFDNLLKLVKLNVDRLKKSTKHQRRYSTEIASTQITGMINESWRQEEVRVKIGLDGDDLIVFVEDEVGAYDKPSKRSKGFQWYLAFYINFMAGSKEEFENTVLLLDDAGVYLHPSGQKDLLRTFEKIAENNQIVYSTHLPYMIPKEHLERVRILSKEENEVGTLIKEKLHDSEADALEPIRAAIGVTIGDSLIFNKKNIIVEGYSDYLILEGMATYLERQNEDHLDFSIVSIVPVGGAEKIPFYSLLVWKENLDFIVILDNDNAGRRIAKELEEKYFLEVSRIVKLDEIFPKDKQGKDIEIEDLIDTSLYNKAVNEAYGKILKEKQKDGIKIEDLGTRIRKQTKRYQEFFRKNNLGDFDKVLVAKQIRNLTSDISCSDKILGKDTVENFKRLLELINGRLNKDKPS